MGTSKKTGIRYADLPALERAQFLGNPAASRFAEQVRLMLETRFGHASQKLDRAVTWGDLLESGVVSMRRQSGEVVTVENLDGDFLPSNPTTNDGIPPAPTGVSATPGLATIIVEWNKPSFPYFGYAEVWRSATDNLGNALQIGQTTSWVYADPVDESATYYYWIRFVSAGGKVGPFNAVGGAEGATSLDPAYLIDVLSSNDPKALLYEIPSPTTINGVPVPAGIYIRDLFVANGSISNAKIGNAAIDDAKIANLSAAKVTFGEMHGDRIQANTLNADRITTNTLVARLAILTTAYVDTANIEDAAITTAKILNAAIDSAKIDVAAVTTAKIDDLAVTVAKIANLSVTAAKIANANVTNAKIANLAVTNAKIGNAAITYAKIGNAQVDTLKIAGEAVSIARSTTVAQSWGGGGYFLGTWYTLGYFVMPPGTAANSMSFQFYPNMGASSLTPTFRVLRNSGAWSPELSGGRQFFSIDIGTSAGRTYAVQVKFNGPGTGSAISASADCFGLGQKR